MSVDRMGTESPCVDCDLKLDRGYRRPAGTAWTWTGKLPIPPVRE